MDEQTVINQVIGEAPYGGFELHGRIIREDTFGIIKRLKFFFEQIEKLRRENNLSIDELCILDIGCGTGINVTIPLAKAGYKVLGIDSDPLSIDRARELSMGMSNISFSCKSIDSLQIKKLFHVVICSEVLEHVESPDSFLLDVNSVLEKDGVLLVTVPNGYGYFELESLIDSRFPSIASFADNIQQRLVRKFGSEKLKDRHSKERTIEYCDFSTSSLEPESFHCNHFTTKKISTTVQNGNFIVTEFKCRTFLAGNIINVFLRESDRLLNLNGKVADYLPKWMCSGWMIAACKRV